MQAAAASGDATAYAAAAQHKQQAEHNLRDWGAGGNKSRALNAVTTVLSGSLSGQSGVQVAANTLAPYAATVIGDTFGQNGRQPNQAAQLLSHAILGAALAYANGGDAKAGAAAGAGAEAAALVLTRTLYGAEAAKRPDLLPEREKAQIRNLSSAVAAVMSGAVSGGKGDTHTAGVLADAQTGGVVGRNAVAHNYLTANTIDRFKADEQTRESLLRLFKANQNNLLSQCGQNQGSTQCRDAARYTLAFINHPDAMRHFPDQVREASNNLARFPSIPEAKSFRWSDYTRGMGGAIASSLKGEHLPSGGTTGYLTGILQSLAGAARDAQTPGEMLYGSPVGTFGDNQWARPDPYELNTKQELWGSYVGMAGGALAGRPTIRGRVPGVAGRGSGRTPPAARTPSPVDGEMVFKPQSAPRGAIRAQSYQQNWQQVSLEDAIRKFIGSSPYVSFTPSGKAIYQGQGQIRIIHDVGGNYFRIEHTGLTGRRKYLDLDGRVPNNKINSDGSQSGRSQGEYNEATHFRIK